MKLGRMFATRPRMKSSKDLMISILEDLINTQGLSRDDPATLSAIKKAKEMLALLKQVDTSIFEN